jgi:hypothetical protein
MANKPQKIVRFEVSHGSKDDYVFLGFDAV